MRIGRIIGTVTLNKWHPSFDGARFRLVVPLTLDNLSGKSQQNADEIVVYDELGSGMESRIAISEGSEAAQPFYPQTKPVDAYNAAILDEIHLDPQQVDSLNRSP